MHIYLAARYSRREELLEYRAQLEALGHIVTSRWLNGSHQIDGNGQPIGDAGERAVETGSRHDLARHFAQEDVEDVVNAECVISFTEQPRVPGSSRGGRHVEFGIAQALGKRQIVVGYRENVFHWLAGVEFFPSWAEALAALSGIQEAA